MSSTICVCSYKIRHKVRQKTDCRNIKFRGFFLSLVSTLTSDLVCAPCKGQIHLGKWTHCSEVVPIFRWRLFAELWCNTSWVTTLKDKSCFHDVRFRHHQLWLWSPGGAAYWVCVKWMNDSKRSVMVEWDGSCQVASKWVRGGRGWGFPFLQEDKMCMSRHGD